VRLQHAVMISNSVIAAGTSDFIKPSLSPLFRGLGAQ
jgi:hypothetical protein